MEEKFKAYLLKIGLKGAPNSYPKAINLISDHYSSQTGKYVDIYSLNDINLLKSIVTDYSQSGRFSEFGYQQHGRFRAAIQKYFEFFNNHNIIVSNKNVALEAENFENLESIEDIIETSFTYEKDLQKSLCSDVENLFPEYKIFGRNKEGIEYLISGKRIDILLSHKETGDLLVIELKSSKADFKVFGQISMYIGLLKNKFPNKKIKGLIIAGSIDESLSLACSTSNSIFLKTYKMKLELEDFN